MLIVTDSEAPLLDFELTSPVVTPHVATRNFLDQCSPLLLTNGAVALPCRSLCQPTADAS